MIAYMIGWMKNWITTEMMSTLYSIVQVHTWPLHLYVWSFYTCGFCHQFGSQLCFFLSLNSCNHLAFFLYFNDTFNQHLLDLVAVLLSLFLFSLLLFSLLSMYVFFKIILLKKKIYLRTLMRFFHWRKKLLALSKVLKFSNHFIKS